MIELDVAEDGIGPDNLSEIVGAHKAFGRYRGDDAQHHGRTSA